MFKKIIPVSFTIIIFLLVFAVAAIVVSPTSKNVAEDVSNVFNITINNTNDGQIANITEVNITIPSSFSFAASSNGTSVSGSAFKISSTVASWVNASSYVVNGSTTNNNFWINITATSPGNYNITLSISNGTFLSLSNLSVSINDSTVPASISYTTNTETNDSYVSRSTLLINVSASDAETGVLDMITINLFNSTYARINQSVSSTNPLFRNYTSLADGIYHFNATVNDTYGNSNASIELRTVTLDTRKPVLVNATNTDTNNSIINVTRIQITINITEINPSNITFYLYNDTSRTLLNTTIFYLSDNLGINNTINFSRLWNGNYSYNVSVYDKAGNVNITSLRTVQVVDNVAPANISLVSPADGVNETVTARNFTFNVSDTNEISSCTLYVDSKVYNILASPSTSNTNSMYNSSFTDGSHTWSVNCTDLGGNKGNSSTRTFSVYSIPAATSSPGSSGVGAAVYSVTAQQLEDGYKRDLYKDNKISFKVGKDSHTLKLKDIKNKTATIVITSDPQEATLSEGETKKFDLNNDKVYDLSVKLDSIVGPTTSYPRARLIITSIEEAITAGTTSTTTSAGNETQTGEGASSSASSWKLIVAIIIIVLIILGIAGYLSSRKK